MWWSAFADQDLLSFAKLTMDRPLHVRFIEYMPVGAGTIAAWPETWPET